MRPNFTQCANAFTSGNYPHFTYNYSYLKYNYTGPVRGILNGVNPRPPLITVQGCKDLCGEGSQYYPWSEVSSTITTWVSLLPHPLRSAAHTDDGDRSYQSLASFFRPPSKVMSTSIAAWPLPAGLATPSRASLTSCGTSKSLANVP